MPNNWKTYKLGELCTNVTSGGTPNTRKLEYYNGNIPWLKTQEVNFNKIHKTETKITELGLKNSSAKIIPKNNVIIAMYGATAGRLAINKIPLSTNQACCNLTVNDAKADYRYIYYNLFSRFDKIADMAVGGAQQNLNAGMIKNLEIQLPPLLEQQSIASILSAIDDKIENNLAINKTLEEMAMALYKHWFVDFGPFQDGEFVESELGLIPKGWEVKRLDEIITVKRGGSPRPIQDFLAPDGLPWVKISDATASNSPYLMETKEFIKKEGLRKTVLLKKGSLILSNSASPGIPKFLELDACIHDGWLHFPEINRFGKYLLFLTFLRIKEELIQKGNGSVFTNLKTDILKSQLVTLPPNNIEEKINSKIKSYFKQIRSNSIENQTLTQLRDTLLPKLISGEVRLKEFRESE
jgi:type I restriction enzyme S subunit